MVKVENSAHHKEGEIMKEPAQSNLSSTMKHNSGQFWNTNKQASAGGKKKQKNQILFTSLVTVSSM